MGVCFCDAFFYACVTLGVKVVARALCTGMSSKGLEREFVHSAAGVQSWVQSLTSTTMTFSLSPHFFFFFFFKFFSVAST